MMETVLNFNWLGIATLAVLVWIALVLTAASDVLLGLARAIVEELSRQQDERSAAFGRRNDA